MKVKVTAPFKIRGELMTPGTVLNIADEALTQLAGRVVPVEPVTTEVMEAEYLHLLAAWWNLDVDPESMSMDQARQLVDRLDVLYRSLRSNGRNPPIRLPVERTRDQVQRGGRESSYPKREEATHKEPLRSNEVANINQADSGRKARWSR